MRRDRDERPLERADPGRLERPALVDEPAVAQVRPQEERGVGVAREERLELGAIGGHERPHGDGHDALLARRVQAAQAAC